MKYLRNIIKNMLLLYQITGWLRPQCCRFYPSCSQYAIEAIEDRGLAKGLYLTFRRLLKCNQFFPGGYDPVK